MIRNASVTVGNSVRSSYKRGPGAALRVVARDGYGNVFEQTEITTPLEADYPDAY